MPDQCRSTHRNRGGSINPSEFFEKLSKTVPDHNYDDPDLDPDYEDSSQLC